MKTNKPYLGAAIVLFLFALVSPLVHAITTEPYNAACSVSVPGVVLQTPASDCVPLQLVTMSFEQDGLVRVEHERSYNNTRASSVGFGLNEAVPLRRDSHVRNSVAPHLDNTGNEQLASRKGRLSSYAAPNNDTARQRLPLTG